MTKHRHEWSRVLLAFGGFCLIGCAGSSSSNPRLDSGVGQETGPLVERDGGADAAIGDTRGVGDDGKNDDGNTSTDASVGGDGRTSADVSAVGDSSTTTDIGRRRDAGTGSDASTNRDTSSGTDADASTTGDAKAGTETSPDADTGTSSDTQPSTDTPLPTPRIAALWGLHDGEKIERDDLASPYKLSNSAWDGKTIKIFGGRNEMLAFQLIVEASSAGITALRVSLPTLKQRAGDASIMYAPPGADPTDYVGRPIQVFSQNYMNITKPTNASWITVPGEASSPKDMVGWKPVQLVPENATAGRGGFPLAVPPVRNQGFWFDVYVDAGVPAGYYDGTITVDADGDVQTVPVELRVFDFTLPDKNSMNYMLYFEPEQVETYQGSSAFEDRYHRFAHRHRVEFVHSYDEDAVSQHMPRFHGEDFTPANKYAGPGAGVGNVVLPRTFCSPGSLFDDQTSAWTTSDSWITFLNENVPGAVTFVYMPDEPGSGDFPYIIEIANNIHSNPGPGKDLPVFATSSYVQQLADAVDIWASNADGYDIELALKERSHGDDFWYYNGQRPYIGCNAIDCPATDPRVHGWASFKHGVRVYFNWHVDHWTHNSQMASGYEKNQNVWLDPITFRNRDGDYANGDGVLVYPGQERIHSDQDRGIAGPISSIQMANLRRGAQDHLYLTMARSLGLDSVVNEAITAVVPAVFSDSGNAVRFPEHGDTFESARYRLAQALDGK